MMLTLMVDVRFKANGLESIEVQDNGLGISKDNYETVGKSLMSNQIKTLRLMLNSSPETLHL